MGNAGSRPLESFGGRSSTAARSRVDPSSISPTGLVPSCAEGGGFGVLLGIGTTLVGRLILFRALAFDIRRMRLRRGAACPIGGTAPSITALIDYEAFCGVGAGTDPPVMGPEIKARALAQALQDGTPPLLIDVRERPEWEIGHIAGARWIPLRELPGRMAEIDGQREIVTICHTGVRSMRALEFLRQAGLTRVRSLAGGMEAWSVDIDPSIPRY